MIQKVILFTFISVGLLFDVVVAQEMPLKVFIFAGQSNMGGNDLKSPPPSKTIIEENKVLFFADGQWLSLETTIEAGQDVGPEISFAQRMAASKMNEPIGIIKHSIGGTSLEHQWNPTKKQSVYTDLLSKVKDAKQKMNIEIVGMLWMQGETDSQGYEEAHSYARNLSGFIKAARRDFDSPKMLFIAGRVNPPPKAGSTEYPYVTLVRKAQEECNLVGYAFVDCDTLEKISDNIHYSNKGKVELGCKFADAIMAVGLKNNRMF